MFDYLSIRVVFYPNVSMKLSDFSKTVSTIFIEYCSHSTTISASAFAKASISFDWDVRNISKISPKMAKKQPYFDIFDFFEYCSYDSNLLFYSHSTPYYSIVLYMHRHSNRMAGI